jgi:hypothetical protein
MFLTIWFMHFLHNRQGAELKIFMRFKILCNPKYESVTQKKSKIKHYEKLLCGTLWITL